MRREMGCKGRNLLDGGIEGESRREEGSFVEENDEVANSLVRGILLDLAPELLHDGVVRAEKESQRSVLPGGHARATQKDILDLERLLALHV
jgi:hypothetical protein